MMVIFSDGYSASAGNWDFANYETAVETARQHGVTLFPAVVNASMASVLPDATARTPRTSSDRNRATTAPPSNLPNLPSLLKFQDLGGLTGGRLFNRVESDGVVHGVLGMLAKDVLQYDYVAGYYPTSSGDNRRHNVEVTLNDKRTGDVIGGARLVTH